MFHAASDLFDCSPMGRLDGDPQGGHRCRRGSTREDKARGSAGRIGYKEQYDGVRGCTKRNHTELLQRCSKIIPTLRYFPATRSRSWSPYQFLGSHADGRAGTRGAAGWRPSSSRNASLMRRTILVSAPVSSEPPLYPSP